MFYFIIIIIIIVIEKFDVVLVTNIIPTTTSVNVSGSSECVQTVKCWDAAWKPKVTCGRLKRKENRFVSVLFAFDFRFYFFFRFISHVRPAWPSSWRRGGAAKRLTSAQDWRKTPRIVNCINWSNYSLCWLNSVERRRESYRILVTSTLVCQSPGDGAWSDARRLDSRRYTTQPVGNNPWKL